MSAESSVNEPDATDRGISIGSSSPLTRSARPSSLPIAAPAAMIGAARIVAEAAGRAWCEKGHARSSLLPRLLGARVSFEEGNETFEVRG